MPHVLDNSLLRYCQLQTRTTWAKRRLLRPLNPRGASRAHGSLSFSGPQEQALHSQSPGASEVGVGHLSMDQDGGGQAGTGTLHMASEGLALHIPHSMYFAQFQVEAVVKTGQEMTESGHLLSIE
ncbi:hypothetical protein CMEL01_10540 [Colletotrichum melonis]|nr:uncharacterized protein CCOS01_01355 [Colletotrichum costaricense]XP_060382484.1 uncharacterized protein CTAM01_06957 [Colletotrichum tamarilloi]KAK1446297.1 hypothetical protein CMEL01_10540 [Colletotrichum melonis]KAK1499763.1 hypothetical protein CTAM01_06957 [Colletotrichum tamarilloi]KAK1540041.1 hypothetical protein CCOS01_01355 [Colletotrichum costaricense]